MTAVAQRWTEDEKLEVFKAVGSMGWSGLQRRAGDSYDDPDLPPGRSLEAIRRQVRRLCGSGVRRGAISLSELARTTGYHKTQLRRAQGALNQAWQRMSRRGAYLITDDQARDLVAWLSHDFWCIRKRLYCCDRCSTSQRPHLSAGLCVRCYHRYRKRCRARGISSSLVVQRQMVADIFLDCADVRVHAKNLEEVQSRLSSGLALTDDLLDWLVTVYERRRDTSGTDPA